MRLAAQMSCTLEELGERMSSEEFDLWMTFMDEEPLGAEAVRVGVAQLRSAMANGPLKPATGRTSFSPVDFVSPRWQADTLASAAREPTAEEIEARFAPRH